MSRQSSFLGTGWAFPPTFFGGGHEVEMVSDVEDIHQSLQILLSTGLGERVMQESYGCDLSTILFEEIDQSTVNILTNLISDAILYHEPRIILDRLEVTQDSRESGLLLISLEYTVPFANSRFNMVYPFYINETNIR